MRKTKSGRITPLDKLVLLSGLVTTGATVVVAITVLTGNDPATLVCAHVLTVAFLMSLTLAVLQRAARKLRGLAKGSRR